MTMRDGLVDQSAKFKKRVASEETSGYKVVSRGQLVLGFPIDEGVLAVQDKYDEAIVSPAYGVWDIDAAEWSGRYLQRYLRSPLALRYYKAKLRGTTARRRSLPVEVFLNLAVPKPSLAEQRRISDILDRADAMRAMRRKAIGCAASLKQAMFLETFGDPASDSRWSRGVVGDLLSSASYGTSEKAGTVGEIPVLRMSNITPHGEMDLTDLKYMTLPDGQRARYMVESGDLLFNRTNSRELVGKTAVFRGPEPMAYAGYLIRLRTNERGVSDYLSAYLNSRHGKATLRGMCKSIIGMANINATELRSIPILIPPVERQREFASRVAALDGLKTAHRTSLAEMDALFASLQHRAFRGEL